MSNKVADSLETIEGVAKSTGSAVKQGVQNVTSDAAQALTGSYDTGANENIIQGVKQLPSQQKSHIKADDSQKAVQIRQNIANINAQIVEIRKKRQQQSEQIKQVEEHKDQEKKYEDKKKDSVLAKLIKSRKGTKEGMPRVSG